VRVAPGRRARPRADEGTTYGIGDSFLTTYLLPFELASIVLLTALVGAVVLSRKGAPRLTASAARGDR
jgi:NADH-quinone oxidoreductase subunit J